MTSLNDLVIFEFFDFNENNYLEEVDLHFMFQSSINAVFKMFSYASEKPREDTYEAMTKLTTMSFPDGMKVTITDLLKWGTTAMEFKEFFTLIELLNSKN